MRILINASIAIPLIALSLSAYADNSARINEISSQCYQLLLKKMDYQEAIKQIDNGIRERSVVMNELRRLDSEAKKLAKMKEAEEKAKKEEASKMPAGQGNAGQGALKGQQVRDGGGVKKSAGNDALITENSKSIGPSKPMPTAKKEDRTATPLGQDVR